MKRAGRVLLFLGAMASAVLPLSSQAPAVAKPSFDVISIKPTAPGSRGGGGGPRGDRYTMSGVTLRALLGSAYQRLSTGVPVAPLQIIGGPAWIDSERYDVQATADCSAGVLSREQLQLMVRSMLENRFQLKAHLETRELPIYNLVVAKDGLKIKPSEDQTPVERRQTVPSALCGPIPGAPATPPVPIIPPGQRGSPFDPNSPAPRGFIGGSFSQTSVLLRGSAVPFSNMIGMMQQQAGRPIIDKTEVKGLYDFVLRFSPDGANSPLVQSPAPPSPAGGAGPATTNAPAAEPLPSLFTALQELGLKLDSAKGPIEVLVVESVQKPTEN
jgi:uncharacterized protein (TIGR03435 family)